MMDTDVATGNRIKYVRTVVLGITSQQEFAEPLNVTRGAVGNWELGKGIKLENLRRIADHYQVSFEWLSTNRGTKPLPKGWDPADVDPDEPNPEGRADESPAPQEAGDVANLNIRGGMGVGSPDGVESDERGQIYADHVSGFWRFPPAVKAGWRNMPNVYSLPVEGDSMEPTLTSGSYVFVDMTHTVPSPEDIYACDYGDGLTIKRLQMVPRTDKIMVMSDNARYSSYELRRDDVRVYGRVVAWFQWRG